MFRARWKRLRPVNLELERGRDFRARFSHGSAHFVRGRFGARERGFREFGKRARVVCENVEIRNRTGDLQIFTLTLSQLSYLGHAGTAKGGLNGATAQSLMHGNPLVSTPDSAPGDANSNLGRAGLRTEPPLPNSKVPGLL